MLHFSFFLFSSPLVYVNNHCFFVPGSVWFASEMKALSDDCERFVSFPPGHIYSSKNGLLLIGVTRKILLYLISIKFLYCRNKCCARTHFRM